MAVENPAPGLIVDPVIKTHAMQKDVAMTTQIMAIQQSTAFPHQVCLRLKADFKCADAGFAFVFVFNSLKRYTWVTLSLHETCSLLVYHYGLFRSKIPDELKKFGIASGFVYSLFLFCKDI